MSLAIDTPSRYTSTDLLQRSFKTLQSDRAFTHLFIHFVWKDRWPKVCVCVCVCVCVHMCVFMKHGSRGWVGARILSCPPEFPIP